MSTNTIYDVAVIGTGLMGSAATRYLSKSGLKVLAIGSPEPTVTPEKHDGVFASHYDSGRLTHEASTSHIWAELAKRSLDVYRDLEAETHLDFYDEVGCLYIAAKEKIAPYVEVCEARGIGFEKIDIQGRFPTMGVFEGLEGWLEPTRSGHINPRRMLQAQLKSAQTNGATLQADTVIDVSKTQDTYTIKTSSENYQANKVLFATGSYAKASPLFSKEVSIRVKNESIVLAEVSDAEAQRLAGLPVAIVDIETEHFDDFYLVPPVRYPDGKLYLKMGSNTIDDKNLENYADIQNWMRFESNDNLKDAYVNMLKEFFPTMQIENSIMNRCIVTYSNHGNPYVDSIGDNLYLCTAGNGSGAKSADAIGELAASLIVNEAWNDTFFKASDFAV